MEGKKKKYGSGFKIGGGVPRNWREFFIFFLI